MKPEKPVKEHKEKPKKSSSGVSNANLRKYGRNLARAMNQKGSK